VDVLASSFSLTARLVEKSCAHYMFVKVLKKTKQPSKRRTTKQASKPKKNKIKQKQT
jgi:hypothetical protein